MSITEVWDPPICEQYSNGWPLRRIPLLDLLRVIHLKWIGGGKVLILSALCSGFLCGTNKLFPGFSNDFSWLVDPLFLPFSLSYDLLLIFILNCPAASSLKFFKGKQFCNYFCKLGHISFECQHRKRNNNVNIIWVSKPKE
jgi:hypothetical protein